MRKKVVLLTEIKRDRSPINIEATKIRLELKSHTPFSYTARHSFSNYEILSAEFVQNIATEFPKWFKSVTEQLKIWNIQIGRKRKHRCNVIGGIRFVLSFHQISRCQAHALKQRNIDALWKDENFCSVLKDTDNNHMSEIYELVGFCFELIATC